MFENEKSTIKSSAKFSLPRTYLAIDLKSYYASAECAARNLDPLTTNLVVADASRTENPIPESLWHPRPGAAFRSGAEGQRSQCGQIKRRDPKP